MKDAFHQHTREALALSAFVWDALPRGMRAQRDEILERTTAERVTLEPSFRKFRTFIADVFDSLVERRNQRL